jgi:hypothetical protein
MSDHASSLRTRSDPVQERQRIGELGEKPSCTDVAHNRSMISEQRVHNIRPSSNTAEGNKHSGSCICPSQSPDDHPNFL